MCTIYFVISASTLGGIEKKLLDMAGSYTVMKKKNNKKNIFGKNTHFHSVFKIYISYSNIY